MTGKHGKWWSPAEIARRWNVSVRSVQRKVSRGELAVVVLSPRVRRVSTAELHRFEREHEIRTDDAA